MYNILNIANVEAENINYLKIFKEGI